MMQRWQRIIMMGAATITMAATSVITGAAAEPWQVAYDQRAGGMGAEMGDWIPTLGDWTLAASGMTKQRPDSDGMLMLRLPVVAEGVRVTYEARAEQPGDMSLVLGTADGTMRDALFVGVGANDNTRHKIVWNGRELASAERDLLTPGAWHTVTVTRAEGRVRLDLDTREVLSAEDPREGYAGAYVALYAWQEGVFRNLRVETRRDRALRKHLRNRARMRAVQAWKAAPFSLFGFAGNRRGALAAGDRLVMAQEGVGTCLPGISRVICRQPDRYIGWPSIVRMPDGELLVVFSGDREEHVCPHGKTQMVRSRDGGWTWSEPKTINDSPLDDRDAGFLRTKEGTLLLTWFTGSQTPESLAERQEAEVEFWREHVASIPDAVRKQHQGYWIRRSEDGGKTWGEPIRSPTSAPHGPIQLRDGRLLYVGYGWMPGRGGRAITVAESKDDGRSWQVLWRHAQPEDEQRGFSEPHVIELPDGRLLAMLRYDGTQTDGEGYLWQMESEDGGRTWSIPHVTPMWGYPPHLLALRDGRLLCTYGRRKPPFGQRACWSHDGGRTWDAAHEIVLRADALDGDLGYPASAELENGDIVTVYYQIDPPDEKPALCMTRWTPPPRAATAAAEESARAPGIEGWSVKVGDAIIISSHAWQSKPRTGEPTPRFLRSKDGRLVLACPSDSSAGADAEGGASPLYYVLDDAGVLRHPIEATDGLLPAAERTQQLALSGGISVACDAETGIRLRFAIEKGGGGWSHALVLCGVGARGTADMTAVGPDRFLVAYRDPCHRETDWSLRDVVKVRLVQVVKE